MAWEGVLLNKARSFLTALGVIIGVGSVIVMLAISAGAEAEIADQINSLGANLIVVMGSMTRGGMGADAGSAGLTYDDVGAIAEGVENVSGVSAEQSTNQDVEASGITLEGISVVGTTPGFTSVREYEVAEGRFISDVDNDRENRVVVLGSDLAAELFPSAHAVGQTVKLGTTRFTVVGVMEDLGVVGSTEYDVRAYIPITVVFDRFNTSQFSGGTVRTIYVSAESSEVMDQVMEDTTSLLVDLHDADPAAPGFALTTQDSIIDAQASTTETFRNLLGWVAGVSLVVGGIGIMNIMLVSVSERTREIGLRQAIGARPRDVLGQFLLEAVALSLMGGLLGVLLGMGGAYLFNELGTMRAELVMESIPLAFGAAAVIGILFGYYPASKAARLEPIVALRRV
jgi:putative ABC transport system permease protein